MKKITYLFILLPFLISINSCKNEETPDPVNEEELITSVVLSFENNADLSISTFAFRDIDGPGGDAPSEFDTIRLNNGYYHLTVSILNESVSPALDLTAEIDEESTDHQLFYTVDGADITFDYNDTDANGLPIGLDMNVVVGPTSSTGTVTVVLKHQPGIKDGSISTGESDVEVTFVTETN